MKQSEELKEHDRDFKSIGDKVNLTEVEQKDILQQINTKIDEKLPARKQKPSAWRYYTALVAASFIIIILTLPLFNGIIPERTGDVDKDERTDQVADASSLSIKESSKAVLIPGAVTFALFAGNNTDKNLEPFYVQFDVQNEWLRSKLEQDTLIVGEGIMGDNLEGQLFTVEAHTPSFMAGGTIRLTEKIDEGRLKAVIEQEQAVKVTLLDEEKEVVKSGFITDFGKDFTADGIDDTVQTDADTPGFSTKEAAINHFLAENPWSDVELIKTTEGEDLFIVRYGNHQYSLYGMVVEKERYRIEKLTAAISLHNTVAGSLEFTSPDGSDYTFIVAKQGQTDNLDYMQRTRYEYVPVFAGEAQASLNKGHLTSQDNAASAVNVIQLTATLAVREGTSP